MKTMDAECGNEFGNLHCIKLVYELDQRG